VGELVDAGVVDERQLGARVARVADQVPPGVDRLDLGAMGDAKAVPDASTNP
jgi:hypothetical protein